MNPTFKMLNDIVVKMDQPGKVVGISKNLGRKGGWTYDIRLHNGDVIPIHERFIYPSDNAGGCPEDAA